MGIEADESGIFNFVDADGFLFTAAEDAAASNFTGDFIFHGEGTFPVEAAPLPAEEEAGRMLGLACPPEHGFASAAAAARKIIDVFDAARWFVGIIAGPIFPHTDTLATCAIIISIKA